MKTKLFSVLILFIAFSVNAQIKVPQPSPLSTINEIIGLTDVSVEYSRPSKKGREIFGNLVPYGAKWRTGANANTKITFGTDVTIGGKTLKKGSYAIFTVPSKSSWEVIFYNDTSNWGLPQKWDEGKVALKASAPVSTLPFNVETFTVMFSDLSNPNFGTISFIWDNVEASLKIETPADALTTKSIEAVMSGPTANDYFNAGRFYHTSGKDLNKSLEYVSKATELNPNAWWMFREKSLIQAELGDKKGAIASAKTSLDGAKKAGNADYVKMNQESIAEWSK